MVWSLIFGWGGMQKRESPDFRSPELGISALYFTILVEYKVLL